MAMRRERVHSSVCKEVFAATEERFHVTLKELRKGRNPLCETDMLILLEDVFHEVDKLPNIVRVHFEDKLTVVGDLHGGLDDLLEIFHVNDLPSPTNPYLFNGDFVDRGNQGVEVCVVLFFLKLLYPDHVFLNRGNHESEDVTRIYGFEKEVERKFPGGRVFRQFVRVFFSLPLATIVNDRVFVVHAGLSRCGETVEELQQLDRHIEPWQDQRIYDMLWSDPRREAGWYLNLSRPEFGPDVTFRFLRGNNLDYIIRSHTDVKEGFGYMHSEQLVTVNSSPLRQRRWFFGTLVERAAFLLLDVNMGIHWTTFPTSAPISKSAPPPGHVPGQLNRSNSPNPFNGTTRARAIPFPTSASLAAAAASSAEQAREAAEFTEHTIDYFPSTPPSSGIVGPFCPIPSGHGSQRPTDPTETGDAVFFEPA